MTNLKTSTWPTLGEVDVVLIPLGSTEQHGPHLPFETDTAIARTVAQAVAEQLSQNSIRAVVAPAIPVGASGEHQDFPGTISIGQDALHHMLIELARSVKTWSPRVVFVNGHGGNAPVVANAVTQLVHENHRVMWVACGIPGQDAHAGREETSIMLHLDPTSVDMSVAEAGAIEPIAQLLPHMQKAGVKAVSPNGVLGNPLGANAPEGQALLVTMARNATKQITSFVNEQ